MQVDNLLYMQVEKTEWKCVACKEKFWQYEDVLQSNCYVCPYCDYIATQQELIAQWFNERCITLQKGIYETSADNLRLYNV